MSTSKYHISLSGKYRANVFLYLELVIPSNLGQSRSQTNGDNCFAGDAPDIECKTIPTINPRVYSIEKSSCKVIMIGKLTAHTRVLRFSGHQSSCIHLA